LEEALRAVIGKTQIEQRKPMALLAVSTDAGDFGRHDRLRSFAINVVI
jgi:hypothetical protein